MVVARQRPGTAGGIVFLLLEDETGMINAIVPPEVYERDRVVVRAEPLLEVTGTPGAARAHHQRAGRADHRAQPPGPGRDRAGAAETPDVGELRAAAPYPNSFGRGRRASAPSARC